MMSRLFTAVLVAAPVLALAAPAAAQSAPDPRTISLSTLAAEFGDASGHLSYSDAAGSEMYLAYGASTSPSIYTEGDTISSGDSLFFCSEDAAGGLSSCQDAGDAAEDGSEGLYSCTNGPNGTVSCMCWKNILPCFYISNYWCPNALIECQDGVCYCLAE